MTGESSAAHAPPPKPGPGGPKLLALVVAVGVLVGMPAVALMFTPLSPGAGATFPGVMVAALGLILCGARRGFGVTVWGVLAVSLAPIGLAYPAVGVMFIVCLGASTGIAAFKGMDMPIYMVNALVALTMINPPSLTQTQVDDGVTVTPTYLLTLLAITALGGLWTFGCLFVLRHKIPAVPTKSLHRESAIVYGATLALLTGAVAAVALTWFPHSLAGWVILTIYVIFRPSFKGTDVAHGMWNRAEHRTAGTIIGVLIATALAAAIHNPNVLVLVGIGFMVAALTINLGGAPYWQYVMLLTPAMVVMDSGGVNTDWVGLERIVCTLIGLAMALSALEFNRRFTFPWITKAKALEEAQAQVST